MASSPADVPAGAVIHTICRRALAGEGLARALADGDPVAATRLSIETVKEKKMIEKLTFVSALALCLPGIVAADTLHTGTLWVAAPDRFACNLTNVGALPGKVVVRAVSNGKVLKEVATEALAPRHTQDLAVDGLAGGVPIFCEFEMRGAKADYRGVAKIFPGKDAPNETDRVAIPAY